MRTLLLVLLMCCTASAAHAATLTSPTPGEALADARPLLFGASAPDEVVTLRIDTTPPLTWTVQADAEGRWATFPPLPLPDGEHDLTLGLDTPIPFSTDTTPPMITIEDPGSPLSSSSPTLRGTAEPGTTIEVGGGSVTADALGAWSISWPAPPLEDGVHVLEARAVDAVGLETRASRVVTVDTTPPVVEVHQPLEGEVWSEPRARITMRGEPGSVLSVTLDGLLLSQGTLDGSGRWSFTLGTPLAPGPHEVVVSATDAAGNTFGPLTRAFDVDTSRPRLSILNPRAQGMLSTGSPVEGTAAPGTRIDLTVDGVPQSVTSASDSAWSYLPSAGMWSPGAHTVRVASTIAAQTSERTVTFTAVAGIATLSVDAPALLARVTTPWPRLTGRADPDAWVRAILPGGERLDARADAQGAFSMRPTSPISDGIALVRFEVRDEAGHERLYNHEFTVDTTPVPLELLRPVAYSLQGVSPTTVEARTRPGQEVTLRLDGAEIGVELADAQGIARFVDVALGPPGGYVLEVVAGGSTDRVAFLYDPRAPVIAIQTPREGDTLGTATPVIVGTTTPNLEVELRVDGALAARTLADAQGDWSVRPEAPLNAGPHTLRVSATDAQRRVVFDEISITVRLFPAALTLTQPTQGQRVRTATPRIIGTSDPGTQVSVSIDGQEIALVEAGAEGFWMARAPALANGLHEVTVQAGDAKVGPIAFSVEVIPLGLELMVPEPDAYLATGILTIRGATSPRADVILGIEGREASARADFDGTFVLRWPVSLSDGSYEILASAELDDQRVETTRGFVVDTIAPVGTVSWPQEPKTGLVTFTVEGEPDSDVTLFVEETPILMGRIGTAGLLTEVVELGAGTYAVRATFADRAQNQSFFEGELEVAPQPIDPPAQGCCATLPGRRPAPIGLAILGALTLWWRRRR